VRQHAPDSPVPPQQTPPTHAETLPCSLDPAPGRDHPAPSQPPKSTDTERLSHAAATTARYTHHPTKPPRPLGYTYPLASRSERRCTVLA